MSDVNKNLGHATAYGYAKSKGYTGTEDDFATLMASYADVAEQARGSAEDSEAWAVGERDGVPVPETDAQYQNNSKHYAEQASTSAGESSDSAEASGASALVSEGHATGSQDGEPVEEGSPYYHNNSLYYSQMSSQSADDADGYKRDAETAKTDAETAEDNAEAWAVGTKDSVPVPETDPQYQNNAKYYAEQAAESARTLTIDATLTQSGQAADAKVTGDNLANLKSQINAMLDDYTGIAVGKDEPAFVPLEVGGIDISASGWTYNNNTLRCRLREGYAIYLFEGDKLSASSYTNFRFYVGWKKDDGSYGFNGWNTADYTVTEDGFYVFSLATIDGTRLDLDTAKLLFSITRKKGIINKINDSADAVMAFVGTPMTGILPTTLSNYYPEIDTVNKIFTIWNDSILFDRRLNANGWFVIPSKIDVDYSSIVSTAVAFWWDIANSTVIADRYNAVKDTSKYLLLALFRKNKSAVSAAFPVIVDGKFNGTFDPSAIDAVINDKLWENNNVKSINHRGYLTEAPENTLPAFKMSKQKGYKYVETDVRFTSDGVAVLLHDESINRTARNADGTSISSTVNIADITYAQALNYDFGIWKGASYAGTKIPTFEEFIVACKRLGVHPYIEIKAGTEAQITALYTIVKKNGMAGKVTWICYNEVFLGFIKVASETERIGYLSSTITASKIATAKTLRTGENEVFFDVDNASDITSATVALLIAEDMPLEVFTYGTANILSLNNYVSGITNNADNVGKILYENYNT